jgi:hypothetical protein
MELSEDKKKEETKKYIEAKSEGRGERTRKILKVF